MLLYRQLTKQMLKNRLFMVLIVILTILTSLSFFFVRFTIDGNVDRVAAITANGGDAARYQAALNSNTTLALSFFAAMTALTAFVFFIFFYRFFRSGRKQIGCLKALGFRNASLQIYFVVFTAALSLLGGLIGLGLAYPLSGVLLGANIEAYGVSGVVKALSAGSILFGLLASTACFALVAFLCYGFVKNREPAGLISGNISSGAFSRTLRTADVIAGAVPVKNKFPIRIALRKPLAILLVIVGVMSFSTLIIMAYSLNISSAKVFASQTKGHNYEYITRYQESMSAGSLPADDMRILSETGKVIDGETEIEHNIAGLYGVDSLYELMDEDDKLLSVPDRGYAYIGPGLKEVYGIKTGDKITADVSGVGVELEVAGIAVNAQSDSIYMNGNELCSTLGLAEGTYNMLLSMSLPEQEGETVSRSQRVGLLERDAVSNQISGVINQITGAAVGCILIFLALYMNFQDNTRDMLILHLMGYNTKEIRKMLIDVYRPMVWLAYIITLLPAVLMVRSIQKSLSVTTGDYMPFGTNVPVILFAAFFLTLLYQLVQLVFSGAIRQVIKKEDIAEYTYVD